MGVKSFSKIFEGKEVNMKDLKNRNIIVDASVIAYQASLGIKNNKTLTDSEGNPTIHINVVIAKCLNFRKHKMKQLWIFDYHEKGYVNPMKESEVKKRNAIKEKARKKLEELKSDALFSSDDEDDDDKKKELETKIYSQERAAFTMNDNIINDIKFILNCFKIPWCVAPKGYEAEGNLTNRLTCYNKTDEHKVVYHQSCGDKETMGIVEQTVLYKLRNYRERANRERFILPEGEEIILFISVINETIEQFKNN